MNLGEFLSLISDKSILILVVAGKDIDGVDPGTDLYKGEIGDFQNYEIGPDLYLDELYVDSIDVGSYRSGAEYGEFTIYVY